MTGEQLYSITQEVVEAVGLTFPSWNQLSLDDQAEWDDLAFEQDLRDRPASAKVHDHERSSFDGADAD